MTTEPYGVLGLPRGTSYDEVRRAYRRLARESHPDTNGLAGVDRFLSLQSAYRAIAGEQRGSACGGPPGAAVVPWSATVRDTAAASSVPPPQPPPQRVDLRHSWMAPPVADALLAYRRAEQLVWRMPRLLDVLA